MGEGNSVLFKRTPDRLGKLKTIGHYAMSKMAYDARFDILQNQAGRHSFGKQWWHTYIQADIAAFCLILALSCTAGSLPFHVRASAAEDMCKYYKSVLIESGDTLWSIAAKYKAAGMNTSSVVEEIKRMNGLSNDQIIAGNYLIIPYYQPKACLNMHS